MSSVRSLDKLFCTTCKETMLHVAGCCSHCDTPNTSSGAKPIPKPRPYGYDTVRAKNYDQARAEQAAAKRRSRKARHHFTEQRGRA